MGFVCWFLLFHYVKNVDAIFTEKKHKGTNYIKKTLIENYLGFKSKVDILSCEVLGFVSFKSRSLRFLWEQLKSGDCPEWQKDGEKRWK